MPLAAGTRLGPYEILGLIGAGGMGEVYKACDTRLDRTVAIKVLPTELSADPDRLRRFEREARAVASLNHPHILTGLVRQDVRVVAILIQVITFRSTSLSDTGLSADGIRARDGVQPPPLTASQVPATGELTRARVCVSTTRRFHPVSATEA